MPDTVTSSTLDEVKVSELPAADQANATDLLEASQVDGPGFTSRSVTLDQVATAVATSDQITDVIDEAIGDIPVPAPPAWTDITGKPATFPPTTPIPYASISGTPTTLPPSGTAGGDLKNTYPNPLLKPGTDGQLMTTVAGVAAWAAPPSSAPSGAAGGDLSGTYPNPTAIKASGAFAVTGALTGTTALFSGDVKAGVNVNVTGSGANYRNFTAQTNSVNRWSFSADNAAEGGSNAGSNLAIVSYTDAGGVLGQPLTINRSTGNVVFSGALTTSGYMTGAGLLLSGAFPTLQFQTTGDGTNKYIRHNATKLEVLNNAGSVMLDLTDAGVARLPIATIPAASNDTTVPTTAWVKANAGAATSTSATAPASPTDGQMWWNSDASVGGGQLYIRYNDGVGAAQWVPASPGVGSGAVVQTVSFQTGAYASGTTLIPIDDTIPQISEGTEFMTLAITPRSATSKLVVHVMMCLSTTVVGQMVVALFQDSTTNSLAATVYPMETTGGRTFTVPLRHTMTSGTTSAITFRVRAGQGNAGTTGFNGGAGRLFGGVMASSIVIQEVL